MNDASISNVSNTRRVYVVNFETDISDTFDPAANNFPLVIPDFDYIDLSGAWVVTEGLELGGGVRNLFGGNPPLTDNNSAPAGSINGFPNTYDALGRVVFIGATAKL